MLERRGLYVRLGRSLEDMDLASLSLPLEQPKYIFSDITLSKGEGWEKLIQRLRGASSGAVVVCFDPKFPKSLYSLLNGRSTLSGLNQNKDNAEEPLPVGESQKLREVIDLANRYANHTITVLITGETGTGKELVARYVHTHSPRKDKPLVACNMTAIPETLIESELFGYVKGAFTGAGSDKTGLIEAAEGGTLFLDEIGDLPLNTQVKLLRFLESREFYKIGDSSPRSADVRIIAAANRDLEKAIEEGSFRKDLYYRLNGARIILPPLRERKEDIILLSENFVHQASIRAQKPYCKFSSSVLALFMHYSWPGNIRELKNTIESAVMVSQGEYLTMTDLPMHLQQYATGYPEEIASKAIRNIRDAERYVIMEALKEAEGNKTKAAELLGISLRTLYRKLEKINAPAYEDVEESEPASLLYTAPYRSRT
jgi:transcriptional regulator with PAS, ATPase and Fis domain